MVSLNVDDKSRFSLKKNYNSPKRQAKISANDAAIIKSSSKCKAAWRVVKD